jgi:hypothetical protein
MSRTAIAFGATLAMMLATESCVSVPFHRNKTVPPPPPVPAQATPTPQPHPREVTLPAPPEIPPAAPDVSRPGPSVPSEPLPPPPRRRTRPRQHDEDDTQSAPAPEPPAATVPLPQFEQILTPEQRQAYTEEIDKNIANARRAVAALEGRRLTAEQASYLARVRAFIDQANEARKTDLFRARNLAERASVLADDLLKSAQ